MMTTLLFYEDQYLKEARARVIKIEGNVVWLDQTIFFAESGGQESDQGFVGGIPLVDVRPDDFGHVLSRAPNFSAGDEVHLVLDWERRYKLMRLHSALHLVSIAVKEILGDLEIIGSHVGADKSRIDYAFMGRISDYFNMIKEFIEPYLKESHEIIVYRKPENPQVRIWKMEQWEIPCSGLHVRSTKEIGQIELKRRNLGKGKERIEVYLKE
ncbi:MAG: alanyl-tRNA editing protein [Candidatus Korarchaeota archaeon]|nr:alanyl-tRNA editing protein [Thermoproteota archaeon]MCR8470595.1 alanyl-tRNA editing protein [Thermoproteota archaeon]